MNVYITDVPDYKWVYGCMATASGNLLGYWDRNGFPDFYTGNVNGGKAPLNTGGANVNITAMWASKAGVDGRPSDKPGHVDDYFTAFEDTGPDPYVVAGRAEHEPDCITDFIGMDQRKWQNMRDECQGNIDGYVFVSWDPTGEKRVNHQPDPMANEPDVDVQTGLRAWTRWRGYEADVFTQLTDFNPNKPIGTGFTFEDMKAEIDAGYPVLLFLQPWNRTSRTIGTATNVNPYIHAMLAYGYYINNSGVPYVRYRTSWASGDNRLKAWNANNWETDMPVRGVIGYHPLPKIRDWSLEGADLTLRWDGPASTLYDAASSIWKPAHGYVVEMAETFGTQTFLPVSEVITNRTFTVSNCPSPAYFRVKLLKP